MERDEQDQRHARQREAEVERALKIRLRARFGGRIIVEGSFGEVDWGTICWVEKEKEDGHRLSILILGKGFVDLIYAIRCCILDQER